MDYLEDRWIVQINPLNMLEKNEDKWDNDVPPIVLNNSPIPEDMISNINSSYKDENPKNISTNDMFPKILLSEGYCNSKGNTSFKGIDQNSWGEIKQTKIRDKFMRVRIRYSGKKLAIIQSIMTLFRVSYA